MDKVVGYIEEQKQSKGGQASAENANKKKKKNRKKKKNAAMLPGTIESEDELNHQPEGCDHEIYDCFNSPISL